jgi:hypothetical protein
MARLSKILFAILIGVSFVVGSATASIKHRRRYDRRRHDRGVKHEGKRFGKGVGRAGKGVGRGTGRAGRKTGRKIKHIVT